MYNVNHHEWLLLRDKLNGPARCISNSTTVGTKTCLSFLIAWNRSLATSMTYAPAACHQLRFTSYQFTHIQSTGVTLFVVEHTSPSRILFDPVWESIYCGNGSCGFCQHCACFIGSPVVFILMFPLVRNYRHIYNTFSV